MDTLIPTARCRWCLATIVHSPFVAQWVTIPASVCTLNPEPWMLHQPLVAYSDYRIKGAIADLMDVVHS